MKDSTMGRTSSEHTYLEEANRQSIFIQLENLTGRSGESFDDTLDSIYLRGVPPRTTL